MRQSKTRTHTPRVALAMGVAVLLSGCSSQSQFRSLLDSEKAAIRDNFAQHIGATPLEVSRAFDGSSEMEQNTAKQVTSNMVAKHGQSEDVAMQKHLQSMVLKLTKGFNTRDIDYRVVLLAGDRPNAFTPGGGVILIKEGLLAYTETESQVAAVLAHEIAHVVMRHPVRLRRIEIAKKTGSSMLGAVTPDALKENVGKALTLSGRATMNSMIRAQEAEADSVGMDIMVAAGYDPHGMVEMQRQLRRYLPQPSRLANAIHGNHPLSEDREKAAQAKIDATYPGVTGIENTATFAKLVKKYSSLRPEKFAAAR